MDDPAGYLITWTCRGTWLHGDRRSSIVRTSRGETMLLPPSIEVEASARRRMSSDVIQLDARARRIVTGALVAHARMRGWNLGAVNVRSNHVHVVMLTPQVSPERIMQELKAWGTRALRHHGVMTNGAPWTRHGSTRYLWREEHVLAAIRYVRDEQDTPRENH